MDSKIVKESKCIVIKTQLIWQKIYKTDEDWVELKTVSMSFIISIIDVQVIKILAPFKKLTKMGQSRDSDLGSVAGVLWGFDMLLEVLERARKEFIMPQNKTGHLATCIDHSWHLFK